MLKMYIKNIPDVYKKNLQYVWEMADINKY